MLSIFKQKMSINQSKAILDEKFCSVKSLICKRKQLKITSKGLYENRKFLVPFWSMIYEALKFQLRCNCQFQK